ncbi:MAG TPA: hypothetical protein PLP42_04520 [Acidobacteriota bacterium]|jgi:hypothetical protein|nr:hypothetical protein [Acidobacteriota bacterium]
MLRGRASGFRTNTGPAHILEQAGRAPRLTAALFSDVSKFWWFNDSSFVRIVSKPVLSCPALEGEARAAGAVESWRGLSISTRNREEGVTQELFA